MAAAKRDRHTKARRRYFARRPFGYSGKDYDREQVVTLIGLANDEKLVRLGYVMALDEDARTFPCRHCGAAFISISSLNAHGDRRHTERPRPQMEPRRPGETDVEYAAREQDFLAGVQQAEIDRELAEDARLENEAPINWDRTSAALQERPLR